MNKIDKRIIGKTFNNITVLSFFGFKEKNGRKRRYYNIRCNRCNKNSIMRGDKFTKKIILKACSLCINDFFRIENAKKASTETVYRAIYSTYICNARNRNVKFDIDYNYFKSLIKRKCFYCGDAPTVTGVSKQYNKTNIPIKIVGIDRLDNNKGYFIGNIEPCCSTCNMMKKTMNKVSFFKQIQKIYNNL